LPGDADSSLAPGGYGYAVVFTPAGDAANNYNALTGTAQVLVSPAVPFMADGATPTGSTIFSSATEHGDTLADSTLTGDVAFNYAGIPITLSGAWHWDINDVGAYNPTDDDPTTVSFATEGPYSRPVVFVPDDARVLPLVSEASFAVFSPKTVIEAVPSVDPVVWGTQIGDIALSGTGQVLAVSAEGGQPQDISSQGSWSWKDPSLYVTSLSDTQTAVLVFSPENIVDWSVAQPSGFVVAEITVDLSVIDATPAVVSTGEALPLSFGQPLSASDLAATDYEFSGVSAFGDDHLSGILSWDDPDLIPGSSGFEKDEQGNSAKDDGVFFASARFVPDENPARRYNTVALLIPVRVQASDQVIEGLTERVSQASQTLSEDASAAENYEPAAFDAYVAALVAARAALDEVPGSGSGGSGSGGSGGAALLSEGEAEQLLAALQDATAALAHDHPVLENSATLPITDTGQAVEVKIKGDFNSISRVVFNGRDLTLESTDSPDALTLLLDNAPIGLLSRGSAVVTLHNTFTDTLPNGDHRIEVYFTDAHASGSGAASFSVVRESGGGNDIPDPEPPIDPEPPVDPEPPANPPATNPPANPPSGSGSNTPRGSGSGSTTPDDSSEDDSEDASSVRAPVDERVTDASDPRPSQDNGSGDTTGRTTVASDSDLPAWLPIFFGATLAALVAVLLAIFLLRRRARRQDEEEEDEQ
jgi:hypothetical protein